MNHASSQEVDRQEVDGEEVDRGKEERGHQGAQERGQEVVGTEGRGHEGAQEHGQEVVGTEVCQEAVADPFHWSTHPEGGRMPPFLASRAQRPVLCSRRPPG